MFHVAFYYYKILVTADAFSKPPAIMVIFGAPKELPPLEQAERAQAYALAMQERLRVLNGSWADDEVPALTIRIGIHNGSVVVGIFGFDLKKEFTCMYLKKNKVPLCAIST